MTGARLRVVYDADALTVLARHERRALLRAKIEQLASDPSSLRNNIKRLNRRSDSRLRVGDIRIIFEVVDDELRINAILPRGAAYE